MPLNIPDKDEKVISRIKADVTREAEGSNPFVKNNWLGAAIVGVGKAIFDFYVKLRRLPDQLLPDTTKVFVSRYANIFGISRIESKRATGVFVATGSSSSVIPELTTIANSEASWRTTSDATISTQTILITNLTRSGSTATAETTSDHGLASGVEVTVTLASNSEYNVTSEAVVVTATNQFEFPVSGSPPDEIGTPAQVTFTTASVPVESVGFGDDSNADAGSQARLQSPISGVDDILTVNFNSISGGADQENDTSLKSRYIDKIRNPVAMFNDAAIIAKAKEIAGVTRVFVQGTTPAVGQVTVYFMRDDEDNPIPTGTDVSNVKNNIVTIKPAMTSDDDVIVSAPVAVPVDFTFTSLTPATTSMRSAIRASLEQFFDENTQIDQNVDQDAYRSVIFNTIDTSTGDQVEDFVLSSPSGDVAVTSGQIATLGTVTYP